MADKIIAVYSVAEVCSVANNDSSSKSTDRNKIEALQADIAALTKTFDGFSRNSRKRSKSREYSRRTRCKSNSSRYAFRFKIGKNANKCVQPCQFKRDARRNRRQTAGEIANRRLDDRYGPSVSAKVRRLAPDNLKLAKKEFEFMLEQEGFAGTRYSNEILLPWV
ncbi:hypothetical protein TNCV_3713571 [Trichonephila clavipes]|nr:hypothetical protein TNCV_3713571 [Trichonephila clavipes]